MDMHHPAVEAAAQAWLERASTEAALPVAQAIKAIPAHLVTPGLLADLAAALSTLASGLGPAAREVAQAYLDDLHDDMHGFA
ncbi:MAG: hypothetical protein J7556_14890 [Acidovorax sp.]|nr:hypothetical protein [Acidovorax sp.]